MIDKITIIFRYLLMRGGKNEKEGFKLNKAVLVLTILGLISAFSLIISSHSFGAEQHEILSAKMVIDGKPDENLEQKATAFELTEGRIGGGIGPYIVYLCYDEENISFACEAKDDSVSCKDNVTRDFKDSDYIRFYICVDDDFKGRQALNGKTDWAVIFTPQDTKDNWKPMVRECPYNGPGHGAIEGDDITDKRASGPVSKGWYLEAAIPFALFDVTYDKLSKKTFGVYFIAGDTDKGGVRTGEMSLPGPGAGSYWESPDYWQESKLGEFKPVDNVGKKNATWGWIKARL